MLLVFSPSAARDLEDIGDYIALDNPARALSFVQALRKQCEKILAFPKSAPLHIEFGHDIRVVVFRKYVIFYTLSDSDVRIERILHGARDLSSLFSP